MNKFIAILAIASLCTVANTSHAQMMLAKAAVASGGNISTNGTQAAGMTAGQAVTGTASNGQTVGHFGFWTTAQAPSGVQPGPAISIGLQTWPNPASDHANVRVSLASSGRLELGLYDLTGKQIMPISSGNRSTGTFEVTLDLSTVPSGRYIIAARMPGQLLEEPITIIR